VIVDDEESIRKTFFLILNKDTGLPGQRREEALPASGADVDLLIVDYRLPI